MPYTKRTEYKCGNQGSGDTLTKNFTMIEQIVNRKLSVSTDFIYGFANLNGLLPDEYKNFSYGIAIGKRLDNDIVDLIENGPTLEYYNHYKNINSELNNLALDICLDLKLENVDCLAIVPTLPIGSEEFKPYFKKLRYKVSHKMIATRAGLGWIGKTDLFISREFGPRVRLVSILINKPIQSKHTPIDKSKCGNCDICVKRCPAHAANGILWDVDTDRDMFFDAHKCYKKCGELGRLLLNEDSRICGLCVSVCPLGKKHKSQL
jgi:epoxyqueuosine reductase